MSGIQRRKERSNAPLVRLAVSPHNARAIDSKQHRQLLNGNVMDNLIVGALQEGRVDRYHRLVAANRRARSKGYRVLLGNGDVEILVRVFLENSTMPEPSRMAGVTAISMLSFAAVSHSQSPNIFE